MQARVVLLTLDPYEGGSEVGDDGGGGGGGGERVNDVLVERTTRTYLPYLIMILCTALRGITLSYLPSLTCLFSKALNKLLASVVIYRGQQRITRR